MMPPGHKISNATADKEMSRDAHRSALDTMLNGDARLLQWNQQRCVDELQEGYPGSYSLLPFLRCSANRTSTSSDTNTSRLSIPSFAQLLAGGARLILVGDSLTQQHFLSLVCWHWGEVDWAATEAQRRLEGMCSAERGNRDATFVLIGGGMLKFVSHDALADPYQVNTTSWGDIDSWRIRAPPNCSEAQHRRESWLERLRPGSSGERDVVLLSAEAHWAVALGPPPVQLKMAVYNKMIDMVLNAIEQRGFRGAIFHRESFPAACTLSQENWAHVQRRLYGWWQFPLFDKLWRNRSGVRTLPVQVPKFDGPESGHCYRQCKPVGHVPCRECNNDTRSKITCLHHCGDGDCLHYCLGDGAVMHPVNLALATVLARWQSKSLAPPS
jgi:hypothetical protein